MTNLTCETCAAPLPIRKDAFRVLPAACYCAACSQAIRFGGAAA